MDRTPKRKPKVLEKIMLMHAHPATFTFHLLALIWGSYFLWQNRLGPAIGCLLLLALCGHVLGWLDKNYRVVASSELNLFQKLLLYHADYKNVVVHGIAVGFLFYGLWNHLAWALLTAVSLSLLGNTLPWLCHGPEEAKYALAIGSDR